MSDDGSNPGDRKTPPRWRQTRSSPWLYWISGSFLSFALLPASVFEIIFDPEWFAPNFQCDSLGALIFQIVPALLPYGILCVLIFGLVTFLATYRRTGLGDLYDVYPSGSLRKWGWNLFTFVVLLPLAYPVVQHIWNMFVQQVVSSDCNGSSGLVEVVRRGPIFMVTPLLYLALIFWFLHIRAYAFTERVKKRSQT